MLEISFYSVFDEIAVPIKGSIGASYLETDMFEKKSISANKPAAKYLS